MLQLSAGYPTMHKALVFLYVLYNWVVTPKKECVNDFKIWREYK